MEFSYEVQIEFTTINYYKDNQIILYLLYKHINHPPRRKIKMRKTMRKSFKQLLIENKQSLLTNKENMKEIEERIEKRHVAYSGASN